MIIPIEKILERIGSTEFYGNKSTEVTEIVALDSGPIHEKAIFWCADKFKEKLLKVACGTLIISADTYSWLKANHSSPDTVNCIIVENPRSAFSLVLSTFFIPQPVFGKIASSAKIHSSVQFNAETVNIGENVVIEEGVQLGDNVVIGHNTVVLAKTIIGNNVKIGNNTTIGGVGFGYEMTDSGMYQVIPHIGNVILEDGVEIGNGVAVDRAVLGSTLLMENVKVDNLVHIAHGVKVGKNSLIIANAMIAGSCEIGENVWVSPSASVIQKVKIADNSLIGMGSVLLKDVPSPSVMAGVPAKKIKDR